MITRTINKPHFDDLDATRFEMLVMNMVYRMRRWEHIEHFGAAGSDDGIDIQAVEVLENGKKDIEECIEIARESIDSGSALLTFKKFVELNS